jgi:hypothetical protein
MEIALEKRPKVQETNEMKHLEDGNVGQFLKSGNWVH